MATNKRKIKASAASAAGAALATLRWSRATADEKKEWGRRLTARRLAKRKGAGA